MKHKKLREINSIAKVAPYTGAWIETPMGIARNFAFFVAPYTGAWIETRS